MPTSLQVVSHHRRLLCFVMSLERRSHCHRVSSCYVAQPPSYHLRSAGLPRRLRVLRHRAPLQPYGRKTSVSHHRRGGSLLPLLLRRARGRHVILVKQRRPIDEKEEKTRLRYGSTELPPPSLATAIGRTEEGGGEEMAATGPATQAGNAGPITAPVFAAYEPKDKTDPLYLHPSESPSLQLVTAQLEGISNYHPWARAMEMALKSKNKMALVCGGFQIPKELDPKFFYWDQSEGVWSDLKKRFSQQDIFRIAENHSEIYRTKQGTSSVNDYFTQLKLLWDELRGILPSTAEQIHEATSSPESSPESPNQVGDSVTEPVNEPQPRRSTRVRTAPSYLSDYTCQSATMKRTSPHAISNVLSYSGLSQKYKAFAVNIYPHSQRT
nr:uncharacterized protein LOC109166032 [Ipomoea batatas]